MSENKFNELKKVNGEVDFVCLNTQVYHGLVLFGTTDEIRGFIHKLQKKKKKPCHLSFLFFISVFFYIIISKTKYALPLFKNKIVCLLVLLFYLDSV